MTQTALLFDLESTGLLRRGSKIHCIVARDLSEADKPLVWDVPRNDVAEGIERLRNADVLIGHNICGYDIPLIKEAYDFDFQGLLGGSIGGQIGHLTLNSTYFQILSFYFNRV